MALRNSFTGFGLKKKKTTVCRSEKEEKKKKQTNSQTLSDSDVLSADVADRASAVSTDERETS